VPLDGSSYAESALTVAAELGKLFDAVLALAGFGVEASDEAELKERLLALAGQQYDADVWTGIDWNPADGLLELLGQDDRSLVCMASHARRGVAGALLGSISAEVLARWLHPILLVGPSFAGRPVQAGPVVVCVDGSPGARSALPVAAGWADHLGVALHVVTVTRPDTRDDPVGYVQGMAALWRSEHRPAEGFVIHDSSGVAEPVASYTESEQASVVVVASRPRGGAARAILGSAANDIVRTCPVPVLVVPRQD
jgi:nucleotide-binding universal stress UspA family protein